jgi:hypothetical protein
MRLYQRVTVEGARGPGRVEFVSFARRYRYRFDAASMGGVYRGGERDGEGEHFVASVSLVSEEPSSNKILLIKREYVLLSSS